MARPAYGFTRVKREGEDMEAINRMFAPEFRNRLDSVISFGHLPREVISQVVDKFIAQLDAQLADRGVTIALTDEAREWLGDNGYDEQMGARPMGRLIQQTIKTPLADEVLFGRLKAGGIVKVVVVASATTGLKVLGFEFPSGPATPKPEKVVRDAATTRAPKRSRVKTATATDSSSGPRPAGPAGKSGGKNGGKGGGSPGNLRRLVTADVDTAAETSAIRTVPKVPFKKK